MKNVFSALVLTTILASPAFAQLQTTTTIQHSDGSVTTETGVIDPAIPAGKIVDVKENTVANPDGSVTTLRKVTTETDNPALRPAGVPDYAKAKNVTTTTTAVTTPAGIAPAAGVATGVVVAPTVTTTTSGASSTATQRSTTRIMNADGTEKVITNSRTTESVRH